MRRLVWLALVWLVAGISGCGDGVDGKPCATYCGQMDEFAAYGGFVCLVEVKRDASRLCASRTLQSPADFANPPTAEDWDAPYCFREGQIPEDFIKPLNLVWYTVRNPDSRADCASSCEVNTQGDGIPGLLAEELDQAVTLYDFLQAQLNQQCRVEASEL